MKKALFVCAVMLVINQSMFSQNAEKKFTIQTSPLLLFSDFFVSDMNDSLYIMDLEGQYKISQISNISLTLSFRYSDLTVWDHEDYSHNENVFQIGIKPMYIHRPFETGLKGFYIGVYPHVGFQNSTIENKKSTFYTELGFGLNIGYKWIFNSGFTMQVGGGVGKTYSIPQKTSNYTLVNSDGRITVTHSDITLFDFKLGYSF